MMKKLLLFFFSLFLGLGLLYWSIKSVGWEKIKLILFTFSGWQGLVILILSGLIMVFAALKWREILRGQGHDIPLSFLIKTYTAGFALTYLLPMVMFGGEIFRGYSIKERFPIPWKRAMASVILDRILEWTLFLIVIFAGTSFLFLKIGLPPKNLGIIVIGTFAFFSAIIGLFYFRGFRKESVVKFFLKPLNHKIIDDEPFEIEREIFSLLKPKEGFFWRAVAFAFLKIACTFARVWILIIFLGKVVSFFPALTILGFSFLALMIPIPAAIGSHEAVQLFAFKALGLGGAGTGAAFTMILRGADLIISFIGIIIIFGLSIKFFESSLLKKIAKFAPKQ
jgi:uncharacterized protein (TIRG00374 family)